MTQLTVAAKAVVAQRYGRFPKRTVAAGVSNGGNHTDGLVDAYPDRLAPMAPEFQRSFTELERWLG